MLRRRLLGSLLVVGVVTGSAGGLATGLIAGASRTETAAERLLAETHLSDVFISDPTLTSEQVDEIRGLPGVEGAALMTGVAMHARGFEFANLAASVDGRYGVDVDKTRIVRGRAAEPDSAHEMVVGEPIAELLGVDVGDVVRFESYSPGQIAGWSEREPTEEELGVFLGPVVEMEVVGIGRHPADLTSDDPLAYFVGLPRGFLRAYQGQVGEWFRFALVDVGESPSPAEEEALAAAAMEIAGEDAALEEGGEQAGGPLIATLGFVAMAMLALAAAIAIAGTVIGGLIVARTVSRAAEDTANLPAIGMTAAERARAITAALTPGAVAAGVVTFAVAVASSAFVPFGLAGRAEPDPGVRLDPLAHTVGPAAATVVVLGIIAAVAARAVRHPTSAHPRPSALVARLARIGLPVGPLVGVDLAAGSGRGGTRGANHFATAAVAMATVAAVGALVLTASVRHLESSPATYGWTWDFVVPDDAAEGLVDDADVESVGIVVTGPISLDGRPVVVRGISSLKGPPPVLVVNGRPPERGEIVLGRRTLVDLDVGLGDTVVAHGALRQRRLKVVGEAVFAGVIDVPEAGWGAAVQLADFDALGPNGDTGAGAVVALTDAADPQRFTQRVNANYGEQPKSVEAPVELERLHEIESFPGFLGGFLAAVGLVAVAHAIIVTLRRRRPDLAVLRSIGLGSNGIYQAIGSQAAVITVIGAAIGIPLGVAAGQALWRTLATSLGVVISVTVPWPTIIVVAVVTSLAIAVVALIPARTAARTPIAAALRTE
jgi:hypothetical protein